MELTLWTYEGPPHVGALRIAASMEGVHYVLHAPQGDTYADLLFTMIERRDRRPPVTYTTFQARDLGGDTAELVKRTVADAVARFQPEALLVGESCTAELIQDQQRLSEQYVMAQNQADERLSHLFAVDVRSRISRHRNPGQKSSWGSPRAFEVSGVDAGNEELAIVLGMRPSLARRRAGQTSQGLFRRRESAAGDGRPCPTDSQRS